MRFSLDPAFMRIIRRARAEVRRGDVYSLQQVKREILGEADAPNRALHRTRQKPARRCPPELLGGYIYKHHSARRLMTASGSVPLRQQRVFRPLSPKQFDALLVLVGRYEREARRAAEARLYYTACVLIGAALDGSLLASLLHIQGRSGVLKQDCKVLAQSRRGQTGRLHMDIIEALWQSDATS